MKGVGGLNSFLMFYAPFIVLVVAIVVAFIIVPMDRAIREQEEE